MNRMRDYLSVKHRSQRRSEAERIDAMLDDLLAGREVPPEWEPLATAVQELRSSISQPAGPMPPELARRVAHGDFTFPHQPEPKGKKAPRKLSSLSLKAKIVAGVAVGFTGLTGVTAAGALPDAAQQRVQNVVESVTPIEFPERAEFGDEVSEDAQDGGVDGQDVSEKAKENGPGKQPDDAGQNPQRDRQRPPVDPEDVATDRPGNDPESPVGPKPSIDPEPPVDLDDPDRPKGESLPDPVPDEKGSPERRQ